MSKRFIAIILCVFVLAGATFLAMLRWGSSLSSSPPASSPLPPPPPAAPKTPKVTLAVQKSKSGNVLAVQWENLPEDTAALDIFRSTKGKNDWSLWKTIALTADELGGGSAEFDIGNSTFANYSFYIEAVSSGGGDHAGNPTNAMGQTILWISSSTDAIVTTSTTPNQNQAPPAAAPPEPPQLQPPAPQPQSQNSSSAPNSPAPTSAGIPYYTPQIKISGYGTSQTGIFWVQHVDQKIQIGWQDLPPQTTSVVILRSPGESGPWSAELTQGNSGTNNSYSIQIVDDTVGGAYYYKMDALAGSTTVAIYGPVYLPPIGQ